MAQEFLREFFLLLPNYTSTTSLFSKNTIYQLPIVSITKDEITRAVFLVVSLKGLESDIFQALVWQKLWPTLKNIINQLFSASVEYNIIPDQ